MKSRLKKRYDLEQIFLPVEEYDDEREYLEGELAWWREDPEDPDSQVGVYQALQDTTGNSPASEANWSPNDPRDKLVIMYLVDITVMFFFAKDAPHVLPEVVDNRYKEAKEWLKDVAAGDTEADLPLLPEPVAGEAITGDIRWNSQTKEDNTW
ncbi:MAG: hypothetical protein RIE86_09195 [Imperialibacter sp.]|uniref:hypothetical protein n=1 Tax=Imperialibacter sp. TaxID=2038411 RepID=UPI0032EEE795